MAPATSARPERGLGNRARRYERPTAPSNLTASVAGGTVNLCWTGSTDDVAVTRYDLYRGTSAGFTPPSATGSPSQRGTSYSDSGLAIGSYYYKVARRGRCRQSLRLLERGHRQALPTRAPDCPLRGGNRGCRDKRQHLLDALRATTSGAALQPLPGHEPGLYAVGCQPDRPAADDALLGPRAHGRQLLLQADRRGWRRQPLRALERGAGRDRRTSPTGLVAAYGFDEGSGTTTADTSGNANTGTLSSATWSTSGKFGKALSFNGTSARVNVNDSNSLDLTTAMTLEAWVNPASASSAFRTIILKERTGQLVYALYSSTGNGRPDSEATIGGSNRTLAATSALPTGTWTHLASTYDGATLRLYVNGIQVSQLAVSGSITTSTGALRIGGNAIWGEYFSGLIDEVRIYNRALTAREIGQDMATPVNP